jgi:hypothetical protein
MKFGLIPLSVGATWVYQHSYRDYRSNAYTTSLRGIHTWNVITQEEDSSLTVYWLRATEIDTVTYGHYVSPGPTWVETTHVRTSEVAFQAEVGTDSLYMHWTAAMQMGSRDRSMEWIPRYVNGASDTLAISDEVGLRTAKYYPGAGLVKSTSFWPWATGTTSETLDLVRAPK